MNNLLIDVQTLHILYERVIQFYDTTIILLYPLQFKPTFYRAEAHGFGSPVPVSCEQPPRASPHSPSFAQEKTFYPLHSQTAPRSCGKGLDPASKGHHHRGFI